MNTLHNQELLLKQLREEMARIAKYPETSAHMFKVYNGFMTLIPECDYFTGALKYHLDGNAKVMAGLFTKEGAERVARKYNTLAEINTFKAVSYKHWLEDQITITDITITKLRMGLQNQN